MPYNVDGFFKDAGLRCRLKFNDKESVKRFLVQCFLGVHDDIMLDTTFDYIGFESCTPYQRDISRDRSKAKVATDGNESYDEITAVPTSSTIKSDMEVSEEATCCTEVFSSPIKPTESNLVTRSNEFDEIMAILSSE